MMAFMTDGESGRKGSRECPSPSWEVMMNPTLNKAAKRFRES
jgi:hypothetical protein